jgi:hypothetical protein
MRVHDPDEAPMKAGIDHRAGVSSRSPDALSLVAAAPGRLAEIERAALVLSRVFCLLTGGLLFLTTIAALLFTPLELSIGDDLPHQGWNFLFAFNTWHHLLHLVSSSLLLVAAIRRQWAPLGALVFGAIYVVLAPAGFVDGNDAFNVFYNSWRENWVHALLAIEGVGLGWLGLRALARERGPSAR